MKRRSAAALLGAVALLAHAPGALAAAACAQTPYAALPVEITDSGAVVLPADVNGRRVYIYLHMSQGIPTIFKGAVEYLGLKPVAQNDLDFRIGGSDVTHKVILNSLRLGGANFEKWAMYVTPGGSIDTMPTLNGLPVIGALTSAFMTQVDVELNLARKQVNLFKQTSCKMRAVYWGGEVTAADISYDETGLIVFPLEVDGKKVETSFNTNSSSSRISELVTDRFFGFNRDSPGIDKESSAGGAEVASYRAMSLTAKGLALKNVRIRLNDDRKSPCNPQKRVSDSSGRSNMIAIGFEGCISRTPMSVGTDLLRKLRIYIASGEGKIYFTRAEDLPDQVPPAAP